MGYIQSIINHTVLVHAWRRESMAAPAFNYSHLACALEHGGFRLTTVMHAIEGEYQLRQLPQESIRLVLSCECSPDATCEYCKGVLSRPPEKVDYASHTTTGR